MPARARPYVLAVAIAAAVALVMACGRGGGGPVATPVPEAAPEPTPPPKPALATKEAAVYGGVKVAVEGVAVGKLKLKTYRDTVYESKDEHFQVKIRVSTDDPTRKIDYTNWNTSILNKARLSDNFGNAYHGRRYLTDGPIGYVGYADLTRDKPVTDLLVFQPPLAAAEEMVLELDASHLQLGDGKFLFRIPASLWKARK